MELCGLILPGEILAARFHVLTTGLRQSGASIPGDWNPENCYETLDQALLNAAPADSVLLYNEDHVVYGPVVLSSFLANQDLDAMYDNCRILLTGSAHLVAPTNVTSIAIKGITFLGGNPGSYRPVLGIENPAAVVEEISITNCLFQDNRGSFSVNSGGSCIYTMSDGFNLELRIEDCIFADNSATGRGGAVYINDGYEVSIARCEFRGNSTAGASLSHGGAIGVISLENASTLVISDSIFQNNSSEGRGGAMFIASANLSMLNCDVLENRSGSTLTSEQFQAPGVYMFRWEDVHDELQAELINCRFVGNKAGVSSANYAGGDGGGFFAAGLDSTHRLNVHIQDSLFEDNYNMRGAGIYIGRYATALVERTIFRRNTAQDAGGAVNKGGRWPQSEGETARLEYCLFEGNQAGYDEFGVETILPHHGRGGAVYCRVYPRVEMLSCTFVDNRVGGPITEGDAFYHHRDLDDFTNDLRRCVLVNSLFFGSVGNDVQIRSAAQGFSLVTHSAYEEGQFQSGGVETTEIVTLLGSPFVAPGNFHLHSESLCIDAGTDIGLMQDIEGVPVPQGAEPDIGAFEFVNANQSPVADDDFVDLAVGGTVIIDVLDGDTDSDGTLDPASVTLGSVAPQHGSIEAIDPFTGMITYTHFADGISDDSFTYTVADNDGALSNEATVFINIWDPADAGDVGIPPRVAALYQNVPNPFNPRTTIAFDLAHTGHVRIGIYSADGRLVRILVDEVLARGQHARNWNGTDKFGLPVAAGVYHYRMQTSDLSQSHRMLLLK